jgi:hypothetical protein
MKNWEWEPWLYEFKKQYGGHPALSYNTLKYLLELWHDDVKPMDAVEKVKALVAR